MLVTLESLTSIDEYAWAILSHLNLPDYYVITRLNKHFQKLVPLTLSRRFPIHRRLLYFFDDPTSFRLLQAQTGLVISGSFVLQFFLTEHWASADLDLYVSIEGSEIVGQWLLTNGYHFSPHGPNFHPVTGQVTDPGQPEDFFHAIRTLQSAHLPDDFYVYGVAGVFNFTREVRGIPRKVQLITVHRSPIETILNFHSSACYVLSSLQQC